MLCGLRSLPNLSPHAVYHIVSEENALMCNWLKSCVSDTFVFQAQLFNVGLKRLVIWITILQKINLESKLESINFTHIIQYAPPVSHINFYVANAQCSAEFSAAIIGEMEQIQEVTEN